MFTLGARAVMGLVEVIADDADSKRRRLAADGEKGEKEEDQAGAIHEMQTA